MKFQTLRNMWVPEDATIILETDHDEDLSIPRYVVYTDDGILRFWDALDRVLNPS